ncbi:MAG: FtsX-like permease family protein [Acidobacteria bacterium]|nr:FtsX-like permease family protein [Acidobacteriota bacterium]
MKPHRSVPPALAETWLRHRLAPSGQADFVIGDLREEYAALRASGRRLLATVWYCGQVFRLGSSRASRPLRRPPLLSPQSPHSGLVEVLISILKDVHFGFRSLLKSPVFAVAALLTIALGIGVNSAIFSMVNAVLLQPLPYPDANELVRIYAAYPERDLRRGTVSPPDLADWREQNSSFTEITAFPNVDVGGFVLTGDGEPQRIAAHYVAEGFFTTLAAAPLDGRTITDADHADGENRVAVLSFSSWQNRFGGRSDVVGSTITLSDTPFEVIGVMPPGFEYPSKDAEIWVPLSIIPESGIPRQRYIRFLAVVGRLRPGVTLEAAQADLTSVAQRLATEYPDSNERLTAVAMLPLQQQLTAQVRTPLLALLGAVGGVLLICCANIANLMLVRAQGRAREFAVRSALGAGRARLVRQLITESALIAVLGGLVGLVIGRASVQALVAVAPAEVPRLSEVGMDPVVVVVAMTTSLLTGLLFGLAPALSVWRGDLQTGLRLGSGAGGESRSRNRLRGALVIAEVALVLVLAIGAGLLLRSLDELLNVEPGFAMERTVAMRVAAPSYKLTESGDTERFFTEVLTEVRQQPGVLAAGVVRPMPLTPDTFQGEDFRFGVAGQPAAPEGQEPAAALRFASDGLFDAMGIPLVAGRDFDLRDDRDAGEVRGIINESFAARHFDGDPIGQRIQAVGSSFEIAVIGVVGDVKQSSLDEEVANVVYAPHKQVTRSGMTLVVRTRGLPSEAQRAINEAIWAVNPDQTIEGVTTLDALVESSVAEQRFAARLVTLFAGLAMTLAAIGIYGVVANSVAQRNREIGIRMALGARGADVARWVVGQGMVWVAAGIAIGLVAAAGAARLISSLLYGVAPTDLVTYASGAGVLAIVAVLASLIPARRAIAIDPVKTLRAD